MKAAITFWKHRFGLEAPPSTGMREALQWLMLARLGLLYLMLGAVVVSQVLQKVPWAGPKLFLGYGLLAVSFAFNLTHALALHRIPQAWGVAVYQIWFDALTTSAWIYFTKSHDSLFALLYVLQILAMAMTFYQRGAWLSAMVSCFCFGIVQWMDPQPLSFTNWLAYSGLFLTLGIVGGYLSEELLRAGQRLKEKSRSIEKLMALQARIVSNLPTGLITVDDEMRINFMNPAAEHILGVGDKMVVGKALDSVEPGLLPFFNQIDSEEVFSDSDEPIPNQNEDTTLSATGTEHHRSFFVRGKSQKGQIRLQQRVEIGKGLGTKVLRGDVAELEGGATLGGLLENEAQKGRVLLFQDVTKLLHLEEKVKQNEKLAAVGQLAAGIAHEIRNPLASMSASIEMLKESLPKEVVKAENQKLMDIAIREIDRLNGLISEFLDFVKPERLKLEKINLEKLLEEVVIAARGMKEAKQNIIIRECYEPNTIALAHPEKLKQVIWNLLVNAIQAMVGPKARVPQKPKIISDEGRDFTDVRAAAQGQDKTTTMKNQIEKATIAVGDGIIEQPLKPVSRMEKEQGTIEVGCALISENRVRFWVADEGIGMSEEVLSHLYEPFFTTKDKGTGLGLATAYKIVEAHHGEIRVTSAEGMGTRFEVILPAA